MSKRKTTEQFVKEAQQTHGDRYDYSLSKCNGYSRNTKIICKLHGEFEQKITHHIDGSGCPKCGQISSKLSNQESNKWNYEKLKDFYPKENLESCAKIFGKSIKTIRKKIKILGIEKESHQFIPNIILHNIINGAEERGLKVEIGYNEIYDTYLCQDKKCALTGWDIIFSKNKKENTASVDRIDSRLGYTKDNIQIVHKAINRLKSNYDEEFLFRAAEAIYTHNKERFPLNEILWEDDAENDSIRPNSTKKPINFEKATQKRPKIK